MALICQLIDTAALAQTSNLLRTDLISPSPTAANLSKYGDVPVTYYTGLPNVSIPIFNATGSELSIPITLTYNFSGLQPYQKPGWVGLGWSLQAGGVVTRSIGDKLDDHYPNPYFSDSVGRVPTQTYMYQSAEFSVYDNEPDVYNFSFGNYSGKFIKYNGQFYMMPWQQLKIVGGEGGYTFTTEDGTRYIFTAREQTYPRGSPTGYSIHEHTSSWYLTKVVNASKTDSISFSYTNEGRMLQFGPRSQTYQKWDHDWSYVPALMLAGFNPPINSAALPPVSELLPTKVAPLRLSSINTSKFTVFFTPQSSNREDILLDDTDGTAQSRALKSITVYSHDGIIVKHVDFEHSYTPSSNKILLLNAVIDRGTMTSQAVFQKHTFEYQLVPNGGPPGSLPYCPIDRFSYNTNPSGPPDIYNTSNLISYEFYPYTGGVNREPVLSGMMYGALMKINYPTGGSTSFDYELNRYYWGNEFVVNRMEAANQSTRGDSISTNQIVQTDTFTIDQSDTVFIRLIRVPKQMPPPEQQDVPHDNVEEIRINKIFPLLDDEPIPNIIGYYEGALQHSGKILRNEFNATYDYFLLDFPPGRYVLKVICDEDEYLVFGRVLYKQHTTLPNRGRVGPGMRLTSLEHNNGFGKTIKKRFSYLDENGYQSGELLADREFEARPLRKTYHDAGLLKGKIGDLNFTQYTSSVGEKAGIGLPFFHKRVTEETISGEDTIRTVYNFSNFTDFQGVELTKKQDFIKKGDDYALQSESETTFANQTVDFSLPILKIYTDTEHIPDLQTEYTYELHPTYYKGKWKHVYVTQQTQYENGNAFVTETKSYYDLTGNRNLRATKQVLSDGTSYYTCYKYPQDYSSVGQALTNAHIISTPIEEQVWRKNPAGDSSMISGKISEFTGTQVTAIYVLESASGISSLNAENKNGSGKFINLISDTRYKKKVQFTYNAYGHLVQQQLTDHPPVSYLWGYPSLIGSGSSAQGVYPVAEIKNAKADSVHYTSFETSSEVAMSSVTGTRSHANSYTITGSYMGKYTLTYWKKTGSGPWQLIQQQLLNPSNYVISANGSYIDEVRLYPTNAQITTYTYAGGLGISTVNDANNKVTSYSYNAAGRLQYVKDHKGNITNTYDYHVKGQVNAVE